MKNLKDEEIKLLNKLGNKIIIHEEYYNKDFIFYYIYQGDSQEAIFLNNKFCMYIDLDEYDIKNKKDEKKFIKRIILSYMEEIDFMYYLFNLENNYEME